MFELQTACFRLPWILLQPLFWLAFFGLPLLTFYGRRLHRYRRWRRGRLANLRGSLEVSKEFDARKLAGDTSILGTYGKATADLEEKVHFLERRPWGVTKYVLPGTWVPWQGWVG